MATSAETRLKLLVPINFSNKSEKALDFALTHAQAHALKAEVYLFHVFEGSQKDFRQIDALNEEFMERMKVVMLNALERMPADGTPPPVEEVHRRMAHGKAPAEILKMADGIRADMIVMGAPGSSAFKKFANKVPCTVVFVKDNDLE